MNPAQPEKYDAIVGLLRRLEQYPTLSPFCRQFYRFIAEQLDDASRSYDHYKLRQAFTLFLRCECRRHQTVNEIVRSGSLDVAGIALVGRSAQNVLLRVHDVLTQMDFYSAQDAMTRELIVAECDYHLGRTKEVVHALRRAVALGCNHPLAHFALGYNIYCSALERFTRGGRRRGELVATDPAAFESTCRDAIEAFRQGLGDPGLDAQIHWWIGLIQEMLCDYAPARRSYRQARVSDPENFAALVDRKIEQLAGLTAVERTESERKRLASLAPISEEELLATRQMLSQTDRLDIFFPDSDTP